MEEPKKNSNTDKKKREIKAKAFLLKVAIMNRKKQLDRLQEPPDPDNK